MSEGQCAAAAFSRTSAVGPRPTAHRPLPQRVKARLAGPAMSLGRKSLYGRHQARGRPRAAASSEQTEPCAPLHIAHPKHTQTRTLGMLQLRQPCRSSA
jgi:hypothetical protein